MPVILAIQEAEIRGMVDQSQPKRSYLKKIHHTHTKKKKKEKEKETIALYI
jgi:hypothetical protein